MEDGPKTVAEKRIIFVWGNRNKDFTYPNEKLYGMQILLLAYLKWSTQSTYALLETRV
jgi:hypothetical protein